MSRKKVSPKVEQEIKNSLSEAILGFNPYPGFQGTQLNQTTTLWKNNRWYQISNQRQLLSETYTEHGIVKTVVDVPIDDAFRGGVEVKSEQLSPDQIQELIIRMDEQDDMGILAQGMKWTRLFGGGGVVSMTDQDTEKPLNIEALFNQPLEFRAVDLWELFWALINTDYGRAIDAGYYDNVEFYNYYGVKLHRSFVMKMVGDQAPSFVRPRLRGWGLSIMEYLVNSINQYLKANNLIFEVLDEFKLNIFKIDGLNQAAANKDGVERIQRRVQLANLQKNYQNALTLDKMDEFDTKELKFTGIAETMGGIRMQIASDLRMPMSKVFGIGSQGFSSGEDDIENYNSMIESSIRGRAKYHAIHMIKMRCAQLFGFVPEDLTIKWKPLRMLTAEQEENVKTQKFNRALTAYDKGLIGPADFKQMCNQDNLLPMHVEVTDEVLDVAGQDEGDDTTETDSGKAPKSRKTAPLTKNSRDTLTRIVAVGVVCGNEVLTGRRKDNNLWTFTGGHIDAGEGVQDAAIREVFEESGIRIYPTQLRAMKPMKIKSHRTGNYFYLHPYVATIPNKLMARTNIDPDQEVSEWKWVPIAKDTHELQQINRHAKHDHIVEELLRGVTK